MKQNNVDYTKDLMNNYLDVSQLEQSYSLLDLFRFVKFKLFKPLLNATLSSVDIVLIRKDCLKFEC